MARTVAKQKQASNIYVFFTLLLLFDTFLKPLKAHFFQDVPAKMAVFAFFHVFEKWLKNAPKNYKKL